MPSTKGRNNNLGSSKGTEYPIGVSTRGLMSGNKAPRIIPESQKQPFEGGIDLSMILEVKFGKRKRMSSSNNSSRNAIRRTVKKPKINRNRNRNSSSKSSSVNTILVGGKILGEGSVSIILSDPRLPSVGESTKIDYNYEKNIMSKQVSRLRKPNDPEKDNIEVMKSFELLKSIEVREGESGLKNIDFMTNNFSLPTFFKDFVVSGRPILEPIDVDYIKSEVKKKAGSMYPRGDPYTDYFVKGRTDIYGPIINGECKYHMIFDKALGDLQNHKLNIGNIGTLLNYYKELGESIIPGIEFLHLHGLVHFDIKIGNIFVYRILDENTNETRIKFKLADFDLLNRIQDRIDNPESYPTSEMRADDYAYYPSVIDAYVFRKKYLNIAYLSYKRIKPSSQNQQDAKQPTSTVADSTNSVVTSHVEVSKKPASVKNPIPAANNIKSGFINTNTDEIVKEIKPDSPDKFNILSFKFYIKYMKTLGKILAKHSDNIQYYSNLAIKIKSLCIEHHLDSSHLTDLLREITEIKYGILEKGKTEIEDQFITGIISTETHYDTLAQNVSKIYAYYASSGKLDSLGFYSFIGKFTDVYSFCLVLLDLINSYVDYLISTSDTFIIQKDLDCLRTILEFIKTYHSIDTYLEPGKDVELKKIEPITILKTGYSKLLVIIERMISSP